MRIDFALGPILKTAVPQEFYDDICEMLNQQGKYQASNSAGELFVAWIKEGHEHYP